MAVNIALHLLDARGQLARLRGRIEAAFEHGVRAVTALLPVSDVDVVVHAARFVNPESGMLGYSPGEDVAYITLDPQNERLAGHLETEFIATLGHELHTCARHRGPGYGVTLAETLVTEGLACHFEKELRGGIPPFYATALDASTSAGMLARAKIEFASPNFDFRGWFFGSAEKDIPRHAGFTLGYTLVEGYIRACGLPASRLWFEPAHSFLEVG